jgi:hypothetical protein
MASNYIVQSHGDLDNIFNPIASPHAGSAAGTTGLKVGAQDLAARYAGSNFQGFDQISFNTNFHSASFPASATAGDLRYIFQLSGY